MKTKLLISSEAWNKLVACRDSHTTEIGGWFVSESEDNLFNIAEFYTTKQECTSATMDFDDEDLTRFTTEMAEKEIWPIMCQKIWVHTHPGNSSLPSTTDEKTFEAMLKNISDNDWLIMFILAQDNSHYCRLSIKQPGIGIVSTLLDIEVESYSCPQWDEEFKQNITKKTWSYSGTRYNNSSTSYSGPSNSYTVNQGNNPRYLTFGDLNSCDLPMILFKLNKHSLKELSKQEKKSICSEYKINHKQLQTLFQNLEKMEKHWLDRTRDQILEDYELTSLQEIDNEKWTLIIEEHMLRKKALIDFDIEEMEKEISEDFLKEIDELGSASDSESSTDNFVIDPNKVVVY